MPKPSDKQHAVSSIIIDEAGFWSSTNDITSPTHLCDIDEVVDLLDDLTEYEAEQLKDKLRDLYFFIRNLK